ncbi:MAG: hypothetical protein KJN75_05365 [Muriicola sp.]|nr:hypothetical protein [Muriicola sp.]NNL01111.1 hypothetical protein [Eudoraea sp.]
MVYTLKEQIAINFFGSWYIQKKGALICDFLVIATTNDVNSKIQYHETTNN